MRELLGTEAPPIRQLAIAWAGLGGWVLGAGFYLLFFRDNAVMLLLGLPAGLLSALAMAKATRVPEGGHRSSWATRSWRLWRAPR